MLKKTGVMLAALPLCLSSALAAQSVQQSPKEANLKAQLSQLQTQVEQLKMRMNKVTSSSDLAHADHQLSRGWVTVDNESGLNFERDYPSVIFAQSLLQNKQKYLAPLTLGGYLEQDVQYFNSNANLAVGNNSFLSRQGTNAYLTSANLDVFANINAWVSAFVAFGVNGATDSSVGTKKAFITFGNLQKSPLYVSVGKDYVPFGIFTGNGPWAVTITRAVFRSGETNAAIFGYVDHHMADSITLLPDNAGNHWSNFAYSFAYQNTAGKLNYQVGAGYINDMRAVSASGFGAYYGHNQAGSQYAGQRLPVWDVNLRAALGQFSAAAELVSLTRTPDNQDGKPRSWYFTGGYSPVLSGKATTFAVSFSQSIHLSGVPMSMAVNQNGGASAQNGLKREWIASVSRPVWENVIMGLEFDHATTYQNKKAWAVTLDSSIYF